MKKTQQKIKEFCDRHNLNHSQEISALDVLSELGEVSKEIIKSTNYGSKQFKKTENLSAELGDLLFSIITLANSLNISLEESLKFVLEKYEIRLGKGTAGSESD